MHLGKSSGLAILNRAKNRSFENTYILAKRNKGFNSKKQNSWFPNYENPTQSKMHPDRSVDWWSTIKSPRLTQQVGSEFCELIREDSMAWILKHKLRGSRYGLNLQLSHFVTLLVWASYFTSLNLFLFLQNSNDNTYLTGLWISWNEIIFAKCSDISWLVLNIKLMIMML